MISTARSADLIGPAEPSERYHFTWFNVCYNYNTIQYNTSICAFGRGQVEVLFMIGATSVWGLVTLLQKVFHKRLFKFE